MRAFGLKCKRPNSVEHERKAVRHKWLFWPEGSTSDTTVEIRGLQAIGCTDQNDVAFVSSIAGDALWGFREEVAVLVTRGFLNQFVPGVVALQIQNGTCNFKNNTHRGSNSIVV